MKTENRIVANKFTSPALSTRLITGGIIGLLIAGFFVISAGNGNPEWGQYWRIRPLLLTPMLGVMVGFAFDVTERLRQLPDWSGLLFKALSYLGYAVGMWIALILGLAGTLWN